MHKKKLFIIGIIVFVCLLAAAIYLAASLYMHGSTGSSEKSVQQRKIIPVSVCSDRVIISASSALAVSDLGSLTSIASSVSTTDNYQDDVNCEYIMVRYYLASGQVEKASEAIYQLQQVLTAGGAYSTLFNPPAINISDLRMVLSTEQSKRQNNPSQMSAQELKELNDIDKAYENAQ